MFSCHKQMATQTKRWKNIKRRHKTERKEQEEEEIEKFLFSLSTKLQNFSCLQTPFSWWINWYTKRFTFILFTTSFLSTSLFTKRSHQAVLLDSWKAVSKFIYTRQQSILIVSVRQFFFTCHFFYPSIIAFVLAKCWAINNSKPPYTEKSLS